MSKLFYVIFFLMISLLGNSQTRKEMTEQYLEGRDSGLADYVVLKSGQREEVKEFKLTESRKDFVANYYHDLVRYQTLNGEKRKMESSEVLRFQTKDYMGKLAKYNRNRSFGFIFGQGLALRMSKGPLNVYRLYVYYKKNFELDIEYQIIYFIEPAEDDLVEINMDSGILEKIEKLVEKSKNATALVEKVKAKSKKIFYDRTDLEYALVEAVQAYNKDAAEGNLGN